MWLLLVAGLIIISILLYNKLKEPHQFWKRKGVKYEEPRFLFGNFSLINKESIFDVMKNVYDKNPNERYIGMYSFLSPMLVLRDLDLIKRVGIKDFEHFTDHSPIIDPDQDPIWSRNLLALCGSKWRDMRMTLSPSFTSSKMKMMFPLIDECAKNFVQYLNQKSSDLNELDMKDLFTRYANDIIATAAFGVKCDSLTDKNNEFYLMGRAISYFKGIKFIKFQLYFISPKLSKFLGTTIIDPKMGAYFSDIIKETVKTREEQNIVRPDMIHLLMEAMKGRMQNEYEELDDSTKEHQDFTKPPITIDDIVSQALIFFFAGFDTTSTFLTLYFYEMALNPDIQSKLRQEILTTSKETNDKITYEKLLSLKYLDQTISEALRLWLPVPFNERIVTKAYTIEPTKPNESRLVLEKGQIVWIPVMALHRDPQYFPEPKKFDPDRFSDKNKSKIDPMTYLPFGLGPRICIGNRFALLESKLIIYYILKHFEIVPTKKTTIPVVLDPQSANISPKERVWLGFKKI